MLVRAIELRGGQIVRAVSSGYSPVPITNSGIAVEDGTYLHVEDVCALIASMVEGTHELVDVADVALNLRSR